jgi:hypothetical protein
MFVLVSISVIAQTSNNVKKVYIDDFDLDTLPKNHYIQVNIIKRGLSSSYVTVVDYGQLIGNNTPTIKDETGIIESFKSNMDCVNFFYKRGWKLVSHVLVQNTLPMHYYVLQKE